MSECLRGEAKVKNGHFLLHFSLGGHGGRELARLAASCWLHTGSSSSRATITQRNLASHSAVASASAAASLPSLYNFSKKSNNQVILTLQHRYHFFSFFVSSRLLLLIPYHCYKKKEEKRWEIARAIIMKSTSPPGFWCFAHFSPRLLNQLFASTSPLL